MYANNVSPTHENSKAFPKTEQKQTGINIADHVTDKQNSKT